jgi:essential nuclear protein 1
MPKAATPMSSHQASRRHNPLEADYLATGVLKHKAPKKKSKNSDEDDDAPGFVDSKASRRILQIGRELNEENEVAPPRPPKESTAFGFDSRVDQEGDEQDGFGEEDVWGDEEEVIEEIDIEPEDLDTFNKFLPTDDDPLLTHGWGGQAAAESEGTGTNLADLILAKIAAHEAGTDPNEGPEAIEEDYEFPPKVVEVYEKYASKPLGG